MPTITIQLTDRRTAFSPGESISGQVSWESDQAPESVELRLLWTTYGKGESDFDVVQSVPFSAPQAAETRPFTAVLPEGPYSFSGTLMSLRWSLEVTLEPGHHEQALPITMAPGGIQVSLSEIRRS